MFKYLKNLFRKRKKVKEVKKSVSTRVSNSTYTTTNNNLDLYSNSTRQTQNAHTNETNISLDDNSDKQFKQTQQDDITVRFVSYVDQSKHRCTIEPSNYSYSSSCGGSSSSSSSSSSSDYSSSSSSSSSSSDD